MKIFYFKRHMTGKLHGYKADSLLEAIQKLTEEFPFAAQACCDHCDQPAFTYDHEEVTND